MKKQLSLPVLSALFILLAGCKKSSSGTPIELISHSGWEYANFEKREVIDNIPRAWNSYFNTWDSCIRDNITFFKSDGTYEENEGASKCGVGFPDTYNTGSWSLVSNDRQLQVAVYHFGMLVNNYTFDINVLDKATLQVTTKGQYFVPGGNSGGYEELRWTYKH